jgi:type III secretion protein J
MYSGELMKKHLLWILPVFLLAGCARQLESGLSERDAQEIVVTLEEHGIDAAAQLDSGTQKGPPTWQVSLKGTSSNVVEAWKILRENGLPRQQDQGLEQVFANSGMIPTASEEKARLMVGLSGELTRTLKSLNDVVDAHVQVVLPNNNPLLDKAQQNPPTASVLLTYHSAPPLGEQDVRNLVAKGIEGLTPDNVSVVMKQVEVKPLPTRTYGPFLASEWIVLAAFSAAGVSSLASLSLAFLSRRRKSVIRRLEKQLAEQASSQVRAAQVSGA